MKTKEELNALKNEVEALNKKLAELTGDELAEVSGGNIAVGIARPIIKGTITGALSGVGGNGILSQGEPGGGKTLLG